MKLFYESYGLNEKLAPLVREISWSHNVVILEKCKDTAEREFYIRSAQRFGWTRNVLVHQIENGTLKIGEFLPEYVGKMQFYLAALDDKVKLEGESPSIGIILCKSTLFDENAGPEILFRLAERDPLPQWNEPTLVDDGASKSDPDLFKR